MRPLFLLSWCISSCIALGACSTLIGSDFQGVPRDASAPDAAGDGGDDAGDAAPPRAVTAVACGSYFTCALAEGKVSCFGDNKALELGNGKVDVGGPTPTEVQLPGPASLVSAHYFFACAAVGQEIYCWGANGAGQLGSGSNKPSNVAVPVKVEGLTGRIDAIATGVEHTCAVVDGAVYCWGYNAFGQLGDGTTTSSLLPKRVIPSGATTVSAGDFHTCAIVGGRIQCWGFNSGALGNGAADNSSVPVDVTGATNAQAVAAASLATCGAWNGAVSCWGQNDDGTLGVASTRPALTPQALPGLATGATQVAAYRGGCAIAGGALSCWGDYPGNGAPASPTPVAVPGDLAAGITAACVGFTQRCAIKAGRLWCWGTNGAGELGVPASDTPNQVAATPLAVPL